MGFFDKIKAGLSKTRAALSEAMEDVFTANEIEEEFYEELEENGADAIAATPAELLELILKRFCAFGENDV